MIDHVTVRVQDFPRLVDFYKTALAPLRYQLLMEFPGVAGLGADGQPDLWLMATDQPVNPTHLALSGERDLVDAFHSAALSAGGSDNGPPGVRADYHPHYYAAFVRDPEGNNIEVVCHVDPEARPMPPPPPPPRRAAARKPPARKLAAKSKKPAANKSAGRKPAAKSKKPAAKKPIKKPAGKKRR